MAHQRITYKGIEFDVFYEVKDTGLYPPQKEVEIDRIEHGATDFTDFFADEIDEIADKIYP
jgi:hypothetical protein